jgi:hypothetical protein
MSEALSEWEKTPSPVATTRYAATKDRVPEQKLNVNEVVSEIHGKTPTKRKKPGE